MQQPPCDSILKITQAVLSLLPHIRTKNSSTNPILIHPLLPTSIPVSTPNTIHHSRLTVCPPDSESDPLPIDFVLDKRLMWISWFPRLRFCGLCRNLEFTITITITMSGFRFLLNSGFLRFVNKINYDHGQGPLTVGIWYHFINWCELFDFIWFNLMCVVGVMQGQYYLVWYSNCYYTMGKPLKAMQQNKVTA